MPVTAERPVVSGRGRLHQFGPQLSNRLDWLRALAALAVLINHARGVFLQSYEQVSPTIINRVIYFMTGFGHQAVMVFFVLSGLLIGYSVLKQGREVSWRDYAIHRFARLYVVLVPAILLTAFWDRLGLSLFSASDMYRGAPSDAIVPYNVAQHSGGLVALGNLLNLQSIIFPPFGSNGPLWSLSYEFWYYVLFPLAVIALLGTPSRKALAAALGVIVFWLIGAPVRNYFIIWLFGVCVLFLPRPRLPSLAKQAFLAIALLLCAGALTAGRLGAGTWGSDYVVGLAVALLLYALIVAHHGESPERSAHQTLGHRIAGFSYTIYLVHLPTLIFVAAWLLPSRSRRWPADVAHLSAVAGIIVVVIGYAYLLSLVTERKTAGLRRFVGRIV